MAEKQISVRYSLKDKEVVERAFKSLGDEGEKFLKRLERAGQPASASLKLVDTTSREAQNALRGLASHAGSAGTVLTSLGPKGLAAAAAIGAISLAVSKGLKAYAEEERAQLRFQAVLKATGNAAGVTAKQVGEMAERLERTTFFKKEDILQAAGALAIFKSVSGDAFESTIKLAADMAEVFGGDVATNARILGKALQDPVEGLSALKRVAGELPPEVIKAAEALEKAGRHGAAVNVILKEMEGRFSGSAQAAASGLAGDVDNLGDSFGDLLKKLGEVSTEAAGMPSIFKQIQDAIDGITGAIDRMQTGAAAARQKLLAADYLTGNIPFPDDAKGVAAMRQAAMAQYPGYREDRPATVSTIKRVKGYYRDAFGNLHEPSPSGGGGGSPTAADKHALDDYLRSLDEENRLIQLNARDRAIAKAVLQAENAGRRDGKKLTEDQRLEVEKSAAGMYDYEEAMEVAERQAKKLEEQQRDMMRPLEHALDNVQDGFADMLAGGNFTARSLVDIFRRAAAEIAAALIFRPIVSGITGSLGIGTAGSVAGAGGIGGGGGLFSGLSGLSSVGSGLFKGFTTPLINPGLAFDIGGSLGLGAGSVGALHSALGNFTPMSGIAGFGGNLLGNALFGGGGFSSAGGTIGGIAGTALGGPVGAFVGSLAGNALGSLFGGGKKHPGASFEGGLSATGGLTNVGFQSKHMDDAGPRAVAESISGFLQGLASLGNMSFAGGNNLQGVFDPAGARLNVPGKFGVSFNPADASSTAEAFKQTALYLARTADVIDNDLLKSLELVDTRGRDAAGVLADVAARMQAIAAQKQFVTDIGTLRDSLSAAGGLLSPEAARTTAFGNLDTLLAQRFTRSLSSQEVAGAVQDVLGTSRGYYGSSPGYSSDVSAVQARLDQVLSNLPGFAAGGETPAGLFRMHADEILVTSPTPGRVLNPQDTRKALGGRGDGDLMLYRGLADLKEMVAVLVAEQRRVTSLLSRAAAA